MTVMSSFLALSDEHVLIGYSNGMRGVTLGQVSLVSATSHTLKFTMALNTKTISSMALHNTKDKGLFDLIAVGGEDGVGKLDLILVECLSFDRNKSTFDCQAAVNVGERLVVGLSFVDRTKLAVVYNDFPALSFIVLS
jgi:hypothetical protein